jgi:hypothetical protein
MRARPSRFFYLPGLVLAALLILTPTPPKALAVPRNVVEMGDPDVGNKPHSGPDQAAVSPVLNSSKLAKPRPSLWLTYIRLLINTWMTLR